MSNEEKKLSKNDYFELREKRLKLVYKILYVVIAVWIASILGINGEGITKGIAPAYTFLLSVTSLFSVKIIKYALMEFRCMKVIGTIDESLLKQTEERYDNIWKSFSAILSFSGLLLFLQMRFPTVLNEVVFMGVFSVCTLYFAVLSVVELFKSKFSDKTIKILDVIGLFVGILTSYSICAAVCLVAIK